MKIKWSKRASANLDKIISHVLSNFSEDVAKDVYRSIIDAIEGLAEHPKLGRPYQGNEFKRYIVVLKNSVYYEIIVGKTKYIRIASIRSRKSK